jgi:hypothetical protein
LKTDFDYAELRSRKKDDVGATSVVEKRQRVLTWWSLAPNGSYVFFVRSGWKAIEFEKGKAAIAVPSLDKLPSVIDTLIAAVRNGELDAQLAEASKLPRQSAKKRRDEKLGGVALRCSP